MPPLKAQLLLEESLSAYFPEMVFTDSGITVQLHRNTHVVLGWAMLEVTGWGYAVLAIPVVYWLKPMLDLLRKYSRLNLTFWFLVAVFSWQGALVGWLFYGVLITPKDAYASNAGRKKSTIRLVLDGCDVQTGEHVGSSFW